MRYIENMYITSPGNQGDGLTLCDGQHYVIRNCVIDLSSCSLADIDEALGITWGCSAEVYNCVFSGAGKLVLCGSGDTDKVRIERGMQVIFNDCLFENFSRRGPEVQDGMRIEMNRCVIRNWGHPDRFITRSFGAWAHGEGSCIKAHSCVFWQDRVLGKYFMKDFVGHIGQAFNYSGLKGLLCGEAWRPGNWRGLVSSDGGQVEGDGCYVNHWWIKTENCNRGMKREDAFALVNRLDEMKMKLVERLSGRKE